MSEFEPWIADCHLREAKGDTEYRCQAAVWAYTAETVREKLEKHLAGGSYAILWTEECLPANQYIQRHGQQKKIGALARSVHPGHTVELSQMLALEDGEPEEPESYLIIEDLEGVEPLDQQFGVHPKKNVPDALKEPLFGEVDASEAEIDAYGSAEAVPPMKTYAILDAAKVPNLTTYLRVSELKYQCLFQGESAEELKNVAPYLVELEEENTFTRNLFTSAGMPSNLWDKEPGIYVRSRADFADVRKHFRKFTRIQDEQGKWYYFRFWEGQALIGLNEWHEQSEAFADRFFRHAQCIIALDQSGAYAISVNVKQPVQIRHALNRMDSELRIAIGASRNSSMALAITKKTTDIFSDDLPDMSADRALELVSGSIERMQKYGFQRRIYLEMFAAWELFYGAEFERKDKTGTLMEICRSDAAETLKYERFHKRMRKIEVYNIQSEAI